MRTAAVLAGGLGKRLASKVPNRPKVLVDVNGQPFLGYLLELLAHNGFEQIILCVGHLGNQVVEFVDNGNAYRLKVTCIFDTLTANLAGTAGALHHAIPFLGDSFWVINGDTYLPIDYKAVELTYDDSNCNNMMVASNNFGDAYDGNVMLEEDRVVVYDKDNTSSSMRYIDAGAAILHKSALQRHPGVTKLDDLYKLLSLGGLLGGYPVEERFYEINTPQSLEQTTQYLIENHSRNIALKE